MEIREYAAGEVLFAEGEDSGFVYRLLTGDVEVGKVVDGTMVTVGIVRAGEFVGEMGVIEGTPRSATVRSITAVRAEIFPAADFLARISDEPKLALRLLSRLSDRLKTLNLAFVEAVTTRDEQVGGEAIEDGEATVEERSLLWLLPASRQMERVMPTQGVAVTGPRFYVGREPGRDEGVAATQPDFSLRDRKPYRLSRLHFAVSRLDDGYVVQDLNSTLGTQVNGRPLGSMFSDEEALLGPGETEIVAGGQDSPFRFKLVYAV